MKNKREYKLPETLRRLMAKHPLTGEKTTQKELAKCVGIRPQTVSQYICGETTPTAKNCLAIPLKISATPPVNGTMLLMQVEEQAVMFETWFRSIICAIPVQTMAWPTG